jgi:tetratricopeptide (TPR) repeat protein
LLAWKQVPIWRDTLTLYGHMVSHLGEHPSRARFDEVLGFYYNKAARTHEAIASFQNAIAYESVRRDRNICDEGVLRRTNVRLGDVYSAQQKHQEALGHYQAALKLDLTSVVVIKLGNCLAELNRDEEAVANLREAIRMQPGNEEARQSLAAVLRKLGREEAALDVEAAQELAGGEPQASGK